MPALKELITPFTALAVSLTPVLIYILNSRNIVGDIEMLIIDLIVIGAGSIVFHIQTRKKG
ncbi:MAG: hypothetical protein NDF52_06530 [archaeon YNP-WB-062]|jgi:hypothetical protein|nr:hypothetical protein [Candidatus Culexarchaeum yellowstonense]MCS7367517.1 hypothetical protein [Candidatus Culexarchaeum yellowstonense]